MIHPLPTISMRWLRFEAQQYENVYLVRGPQPFRYKRLNLTDLTWNINTEEIRKKAQQRLYFLRCLKKFGLRKRILVNFYRTVMSVSYVILLLFVSDTPLRKILIN